MSPATPTHPRARCTRERRHLRPAALAPARGRDHGLRRGRPPRRPLPNRGRCRPSPRRLLPPIRVRRLAAERRIVMSSQHEPEPQPGGPHGPLERRPLEDRNLRLARPRGRRLCSRRPDRDEADRSERQGAGRVGPDGQDPRRRLQAARRRKRPDPEPLAAGGNARLRCRGRRRRRTPVEGGSRSERAARPRSPATATQCWSISTSAATRTPQPTGSIRCSRTSTMRERPIRRSSSASSAAPAPPRASTRRSRTI